MQGQHVAFERRTAAVGDDGHVVRAAQLDGGRHFLGGMGEDDGVRQHGGIARLVAAMVFAHGLRHGKAVGKDQGKYGSK
ncbi:hypothetical protein D3C72_2421610 [compost metagenome]